MITIRPIQAEDIPAVKRVIYTVAHGIFGGDGDLEDAIRGMEREGALGDVDRAQADYIDSGGQFLVAVEAGRVIGSGAVRPLDAATAELKRLWLLEEYQGLGIGHKLLLALLEFAVARGFHRLVLQTSPEQRRALKFYRRMGFREIASYNEDLDEISMELPLAGTNVARKRHQIEKGSPDETT